MEIEKVTYHIVILPHERADLLCVFYIVKYPCIAYIVQLQSVPQLIFEVLPARCFLHVSTEAKVAGV